MPSVTKKIQSFLKKFAVFAAIFAMILVPVFVIGSTAHVAYAQTNTDTLAPSPSDSTDGLATIANVLLQIVYAITIGFGSAIASTAAYFLNYAVHISLDSSAYGLDFISVGWTTLRDIANMAFIFILLYIAIKVMFDANTAGTGGMLAKVLAVALVINFSFFATRVVIDAGNLLSVQFYNAIVSNAPNVNPVAGIDVGSVPDLTAEIMDGLQFKTALGTESFQQAAGAAGSADFGKFGGTFIAYLFIYIVLGFMLLMLAGAFVAAGVKFIVRIVMLWYSIVTAPLALVAWAFQGGGGHGGGGHGSYFTKWSKDLVSNAFYPVVFLFILLMISKFMGANGNGGLGGGLIQDAVNTGHTGTAELAVIIANIAVRLGFVLVMLYFAIKASDYGTNLSVAGWANTFGNNAAFGAPAAFWRQTVGRGANALSTVPIVGRVPGVQLLANSSFDQRGLLQKVPVIGADLGEPKGQGGFAAGNKERKEKKETREQLELLRRAARNPSSLSAHDIDHLNHFSGDAFKGLTDPQIKNVATLLADSTIKRIESSHEVDHGKQQTFRSTYNDTVVDALRDVANRVDTSIGDLELLTKTGTKTLRNVLLKGQTLNNAGLREMVQAVRSENRAREKATDAARVLSMGSPANAALKAAWVDAKNSERNSKEALSQVEQLARAVGDKGAGHTIGK